ncbi:SDR family oxidoreductase [Eubacteriaceae bacterium ES3]|nr:SDR family oxidoreductase [Eubacteriaceae bacterium ES3]
MERKQMDLHLKGKNAVITGGSRGVGRAIALGLAQEGVNIVFTATRLTPEVDETLKMIQSYGVKARVMAVDLKDSQAALVMIKSAEDFLGSLDILVNNAGIWLQGWIEDIPVEDWDLSMDVNLKAPFVLSQYFAKSNLKSGKEGRIININSQAAFNGSTTGHAHYAASKAGMTALTISMARELSKKGITVNAVALGVVETDMIRSQIEENPGYYEGRIPIGRVAQPEEIADIVVFLASARSAYLTGATIDATGGMLMR